MFLQGNQQCWDEYLQQLAGAIRSTVNRNTGFTPNLMMLGREVILPVNLMIGIVNENSDQNPAEYVTRLRSILSKVHTMARENLVSAQVRQKKDYDLRLKENTYEIGDLVYLLDSARKIGQSSKLQQIWKGPLLVTKVLTPILFEVTGRKKPVVLHHDRLKPCCDRNIPLWLRRKRNQVLGKSNEGFEKVHNNLEIEDLHLDKLFTDDYQHANHNKVTIHMIPLIPKLARSYLYQLLPGVAGREGGQNTWRIIIVKHNNQGNFLQETVAT